jgi:hypothetical protein
MEESGDVLPRISAHISSCRHFVFQRHHTQCYKYLRNPHAYVYIHTRVTIRVIGYINTGLLCNSLLCFENVSKCYIICAW